MLDKLDAFDLAGASSARGSAGASPSLASPALARAAETISLSPYGATLDPVTPLESHLAISVRIATVGGVQQVVDAWSGGAAFRGVEKILVDRHPWDAVPITQRVCGVCPVAHALAASLAVETATGITAPDNARILRNLVLGANFVQSHIQHFYHLGVLDYIAGPVMPPGQRHWQSDLRVDPNTTTTLIGHYVTAFEMRRKAREMSAVYGGQLPHPSVYVPGGFTAHPHASRNSTFLSYLNELITFIQDVYLPDVALLAAVYDDYFDIGGGTGNLLTYGVFDQNASGSVKLLARGRVEARSTTVQPVDSGALTEHVAHSWHQPATIDLPPASGDTLARYPQTRACSWRKAPRYAAQPYEVGALPRMWINGDYRDGISVMDRHRARAHETLKIAEALAIWIAQLNPSGPVFTNNFPPDSGAACGLTEAPHGALGHWLQVAGGKIARYQVVTPTCWNASPRDTNQVRGPIEQALLGTPVLDHQEPVEVLRVIHSFDPCLSCAVHLLRGDDRQAVVVIRA